MRALLPGSNIEVEGEPGEVAQLAQLLQSGAVLVEHTHRWRIDGAGGEDGTQRGTCSCGAERLFTPFPASHGVASATQRGESYEKQALKAGRKCGSCGETGHTKATCPAAAAGKGG